MQVWLDGRVVPLEQAHISPFDRGFLFGDGVYELVRFFDGVGMAMEAHLSRLERSLRETRITGFTRQDAARAMHAVLEAEGLRDGAVYLQVTRGAPAVRSHVPPSGLSHQLRVRGGLRPAGLAAGTRSHPRQRAAGSAMASLRHQERQPDGIRASHAGGVGRGRGGSDPGS